jgi:hypothetical protein
MLLAKPTCLILLMKIENAKLTLMLEALQVMELKE